jgi:8-oxo-dGTP diphosphatase
VTTTSARGGVRVAAYGLCVDDADRILLCRIHEPSPDDGRWTLPGGGLDFGEAPEDAVVRELEEEAGLHVSVVGLVGTFSIVIENSITLQGRPLHAIGLIYRVRATGTAIRYEVDGTTDMAGWFTEADARALPLVGLAEHGIDLAFHAAG